MLVTLTPSEDAAIMFLIKKRNMTEYADAEAFIRGIVNTAVAAAVSEKNEADKDKLAKRLAKIHPADIEAFLASRELVV